MKYGKLTLGQVEAVINKLGGQERAMKFLAGELILRPANYVPDCIVRVDRSCKPPYPHWLQTVMRPEIELSGPMEYDLHTLAQWLHPDQKSKHITGYTIYAYLEKLKALSSCLNLQDGFAIQQKGAEIFRKFFDNKAVFLWASVVHNRQGRLYVPSLHVIKDEVVFEWCRLGDDVFDTETPALRFKE